MQIKLTSVYVDDQERALRFYTEVLGFVKKADFSEGPSRQNANRGSHGHEDGEHTPQPIRPDTLPNSPVQHG
jgi:catechol 2,3-dioxygenase-like lactoylglutathione lyase family enzyme